jgi:two-component system, sensor histidine kinase and response regulator
MARSDSFSSPARILVVDDQADNLALMEAVLEARGFQVKLAPSGATGLAMVQAEEPDIILLDLAMPDMDGFEVLQALQAHPRHRRIPVVILTAHVKEASMVERGLELGATEYLTKPIQMDELVVRLRSVLRLATAERELERTRRDFASMLVHDMRAPLDGIRLSLSVLKRQESEASARQVMLDHALAAANEVGSLIDNLLQTNQLEEEGFKPHFRAIQVSELFKRCLLIMRPVALAHQINLAIEVTPGLPSAWGDQDLVRRVLENLLANAIKFSGPGEVTISAASSEGGVEISVRDHGPGIPDGIKNQVFNRYFRLPASAHDGQRGFGLGLAFCQQAVEAMGGTIQVKDASGGGSVFTFILPQAS